MLPAPILSTAGAGDLGFLGHHIPKALEVYFSYPRAGHGGQGEQWADGQQVPCGRVYKLASQSSGALVGVMSNLSHYMDS